MIRVECDASSGLPEMSMVGFLGAEVKEAKDRVRTALKNTGFTLPPRHVTVNLSPADIRKEGTSFDLAVASALLLSAGLIDLGRLPEEAVFMGELGLDGSLIPVSGILTMVSAAKAAGFRVCVVPAGNAAEGSLVEGIDVIGLKDLTELPLLAGGKIPALPCRVRERLQEAAGNDEVDFAEVNGQAVMRRAAEIAAAGMHNLLFVGTPGSGKTMIARRIPTILPSISLEEALEVSKVYSVCGLLSEEHPLILRRPFRSPHHTVSPYALVGGGSKPKPGEISLADHGVDREVHIARVQGSYRFPADVMLVAAMNPCRCGYYPDRNRCHCSDAEVSSYLRRVSRPLLDRIDLCVEAPTLLYKDLVRKKENEPSAAIRARVEQARERQTKRFAGTGIRFNSRMGGRDVRLYCPLDAEKEKYMKRIFETKGLSARAYHRILKVARTIADLAGRENISLEDIAEAAGYRGPEEKFWR